MLHPLGLEYRVKLKSSRSFFTVENPSTSIYEVPMQFEKKPPQSVTVTWPAAEPYLDTDEAAALLRIHPKTLQRMAKRGEIQGVRVGKLWRFRVSDLPRKTG